MAHDSPLLPCDGDGLCMSCKSSPPDEEKLTCKTCVTPWHISCLHSLRPENLASTLLWECPDCSGECPPAEKSAPATEQGSLVAAIRAIEADESLTEKEKAAKRQQLVSGEKEGEAEKEKKGKNVLDILCGAFNCSVCMQLMDRPVTTPCGHNFCLKCFEKWIGQGKRSCAKCRNVIPPKMASQPRINSSLVAAIRMAKMSSSAVSLGSQKVFQFVQNQDRPDKAYTTERAKKTGKANAASGKIFVTIPPDHFGPITAENDPERNQGVLVGECWEDRLECRQWGAHFPHVAGIAGQSDYGSQSVALSGGYQDDEDHGEWFLYTGSGGRDLSGNKRTNKDQSFDQKFDKTNEALRVSCRNGYPVRVVRSHKEKRSAYAPEKGVRYDGIYRIEKCWRKLGIQGFKVCRYLFVRCDNEPAPWTSDERGDVPRPLPSIPELTKACDIMERKESPSWDFDTEDGRWKWKRPPPISRKSVNVVNPEDRKRIRKQIRLTQNTTIRERLLKEFSCLICRKVMTMPLTTPCAHNFCKSCLEGSFVDMTFVQERKAGGRSLRSRKNVLKCPCCPTDISDFLRDPQVNREMMDAIESLQEKEETVVPVEESSDNEGDDMVENPEKSTDLGKNISEEIDGNSGSEESDEQKKVETVDCSMKNDEESKTCPEEAGSKRKKPDGENNTSELDVVARTKRSRKVPDALSEDNHQSPSSPLHVLSVEADCE